jgi:phosphopentomutase
MAAILTEADFVFHEYFATDTYAHKKRTADLIRSLDEINRFLRTLRTLTDPEETAILVVSDHGNCEDSASADHNRNPVPVLLLSRNQAARAAFRKITRLEEVQAGILAFFGLPVEDDVLSNAAEWL